MSFIANFFIDPCKLDIGFSKSHKYDIFYDLSKNYEKLIIIIY